MNTSKSENGSPRIRFFIGGLGALLLIAATLLFGRPAIESINEKVGTRDQLESVSQRSAQKLKLESGSKRILTASSQSGARSPGEKSVATEGFDEAELSEHQRSFIQSTLAALDARLTESSSEEASVAIQTYRQRLIARAHGIGEPSKDEK